VLSQRKKIKRTKNEFLLLLFFGLAATTKSPQKRKDWLAPQSKFAHDEKSSPIHICGTRKAKIYLNGERPQNAWDRKYNSLQRQKNAALNHSWKCKSTIKTLSLPPVCSGILVELRYLAVSPRRSDRVSP
jgi:hypothetical protein